MKRTTLLIFVTFLSLLASAKTWNFSNSPFGAVGISGGTAAIDFTKSYSTSDGLTVGTDGISFWTGLSVSSKTIDGTTYPYRLQCGGGGNPVSPSKIPATRYLKFDVSKYDTIKIGCISSSSTASRTIIIVNSDQSVIDSIVNINGTTAATYSYVYKGSPSSVYIYSRANGINFYYLNVSESKNFGVFTTSASNNLPTSSVVKGSVTGQNAASISSYGFCWNTSGMPTTADSKKDNGLCTSIGTYSDTIPGLTQGTTYYLRAFATSNSTTLYGDEISFTTASIPTSSTVGGNYYSSQYWPKSKSPYTINSNVNIAYEASLTIEPGVVINYAGKGEIMLMGNIVANGTATDSITFNGYSGGGKYLNFKNTKLSNSQLSYVKFNGSANDSIVTQGTASDSLIITNSRLKNVTVNAINPIYYRNSKISGLTVGTSRTCIESSSISNSTFSSSYQTVSLKLKSSTASNLRVYGGDYTPNSTIEFNNSTVSNSYLELNNPSLNLIKSDINNTVFMWPWGTSYITVNKSRINKSKFTSFYSSASLYYTIDSTVFINTPIVYSTQLNMNNSIVKTLSTDTVTINGTINNCQFLGYNNAVGGNAIDAATGTITNSCFANHQNAVLSNTLTANYCNFINITQYDIYNTGANQLNAKNNFWGTGNTTTATVKSKIWDYYTDMNLGKVLYDSYLTSPNTGCPLTPPSNFRKSKATNGVTYTWNANPESSIKGYKLYYNKKDAFSFNNSIDLGNVTSYTFAGASINDTVLVTAYDQTADGKNDQFEGHESWYADDYIPAKPTISDPTIVSLSSQTCKLNATINSLGDVPVTSYGFCWNTTGNPTIASNLINKGARSTTGLYSDSITSLQTNSPYYVRAFATTDFGTVYSNAINFNAGDAIIYLGVTDSIGGALNRFKSTASNVTVVIPKGYTNPEYNSAKYITLTSIPKTIKNLTIKGDGTYPTLMVTRLVPPVKSLSNISIKGLTVKGVGDGPATLTLSNDFLYLTGDTIGTINISDCNISNFNTVVGKVQTSKIGEINIDNSIFRALGTSGIIYFASGSIGKMSIKNSTAYGINGYIIFSLGGIPTNVSVTNCTFDYICNSGRSFIYLPSTTSLATTTLSVDNCVFGRSISPTGYGIRPAIIDTSYNSYAAYEWSTASFAIVKLNYWNSTYSLFKSPTSYGSTTNVATIGDYTIIDASFPANVGDPRWYYNAKTENLTAVQNTIRTYPNPVIDKLEMETNGTGTFTLYDLNGRVCKEGIIIIKNSVDISDLPSGNYILSIQQNRRTTSTRIIKK